MYNKSKKNLAPEELTLKKDQGYPKISKQRTMVTFRTVSVANSKMMKPFFHFFLNSIHFH